MGLLAFVSRSLGLRSPVHSLGDVDGVLAEGDRPHRAERRRLRLGGVGDEAVALVFARRLGLVVSDQAHASHVSPRLERCGELSLHDIVGDAPDEHQTVAVGVVLGVVRAVRLERRTARREFREILNTSTYRQFIESLGGVASGRLGVRQNARATRWRRL